MLTLAIEQSTTSASLALMREGAVIAETGWEDSRLRNRHLFTALPAFLRGAGVTASEVDLFVVDLGPGSFAGIRNALAGAQGMAMPKRGTVYGVTSGEVLAAAAAVEVGARTVAVCGDARRDRFWSARFRVDAGRVAVDRPYTLVTAAELARDVAEADVLVTPDWDRIGPQIGAIAPAPMRVIPGRRLPDARTLAALAIERHTRDISSPPLVPVYLHPPVFVAARFPAEDPADGQHP